MKFCVAELPTGLLKRTRYEPGAVLGKLTLVVPFRDIPTGPATATPVEEQSVTLYTPIWLELEDKCTTMLFPEKNLEGLK